MTWEVSGLPWPFLLAREVAELFLSVTQPLMPHLSPFQWTRDAIKGSLVSSFQPSPASSSI